MKALSLFAGFIFFWVFPLSAQKQPSLPHGTVFGKKPDVAAMLKASEVEAFMGKKTRISTTINGKVIKVTETKGGWFEIDAGSGKTIDAHFKEYNVTIPMNLAGHFIIAEGVAEKLFTADDSQHLAGGGNQHGVKANPKQKLSFEVTGLVVE